MNKTGTIKDIRAIIIVCSIILLGIESLHLYAITNSSHSIVASGATIEHKTLVNALNISAYCISIVSIIVLNIIIFLKHKRTKKFYTKLIGIFSIFIFIIPIILTFIGDYIHHDDIKNKRYSSWNTAIEEKNKKIDY